MRERRTGNEERPDPMQTFYLNQTPPTRPPPPPPPPPAQAPTDPQVPLSSLPPMRIHWRGLLYIVGVVLLLALVSRVLGSFAASVLAVVTLGGLAVWAIGRRKGILGSTEGIWLGDDGISDGDFGGGGGDG